jgi:oligosaccharyltransferase complex subunit alpha (ribophorin I)
MRFIDHVFDEMVVDQATVSVLLPEGAENVQVSFPDYPGVTRLADKIFKTYLDTQGRTVVSATKDNLVENHIQEFQVSFL